MPNMQNLNERTAHIIDIAKAIRTIKDECNRHEECTECPINDTEMCWTDYSAMDWSYPKGVYIHEQSGVYFVDITELKGEDDVHVQS